MLIYVLGPHSKCPQYNQLPIQIHVHTTSIMLIIDQGTGACVSMRGNSLSEYAVTISHLLRQIWGA